MTETDKHDERILTALRFAGKTIAAMPDRYRQEARQEALQRQLSNDEPKCGNCGFWHMTTPNATIGTCQRPENGDNLPTTDLAVCSKWAPKG